jgi:hypothetical protein
MLVEGRAKMWLRSSQAIGCVNVLLKSDVSEISVSSIKPERYDGEQGDL